MYGLFTSQEAHVLTSLAKFKPILTSYSGWNESPRRLASYGPVCPTNQFVWHKQVSCLYLSAADVARWHLLSKLLAIRAQVVRPENKISSLENNQHQRTGKWGIAIDIFADQRPINRPMACSKVPIIAHRQVIIPTNHSAQNWLFTAPMRAQYSPGVLTVSFRGNIQQTGNTTWNHFGFIFWLCCRADRQSEAVCVANNSFCALSNNLASFDWNAQNYTQQ